MLKGKLTSSLTTNKTKVGRRLYAMMISYKLNIYWGTWEKKKVCLELGALDWKSINLDQFSTSASSSWTSHSISVFTGL